MPDSRAHRGAHPDDHRDFRHDSEPVLQRAVAELSYLLTRDYAANAALKLVGDRYQLTSRQRSAVARGACSDQALAARRARRIELGELAGAHVVLDGFNCLITIEAMFAEAPVFVGRDGALRDLASVHGTYRRVHETTPALDALLRLLSGCRVASACFYLDRPVGNSGRLRAIIEERGRCAGLNIEVRLSDRVDAELVALGLPVGSSDSFILERARWFDAPSGVARAQRIGGFRMTLCDSP